MSDTTEAAFVIDPHQPPDAPPGYAWSLAVSNDGSGIGSSNLSANQLDLVVTKVPLTWNGATNGAWDTTTQNWAMGLPGVATTYSDSNAVFFGDRDPISGNLVTNTAVTIQASGVTPASVTFTVHMSPKLRSGAGIFSTRETYWRVPVESAFK